MSKTERGDPVFKGGRGIVSREKRAHAPSIPSERLQLTSPAPPRHTGAMPESTGTGSPTAVLPKPSVRWNVPFLLMLAGLWVWAVSINYPFWDTDPNYSFGFVVPLLVVFFLWKRLGSESDSFWEFQPPAGKPAAVSAVLLLLPGLALFPVEVYRIEYHQSGIVLWAINLAMVGYTLAGAAWLGGRRLLLTALFPVLFFLTAVPWPAKIAVPFQQMLMTGVAQVVAELLLWCGIPVSLDGAVLHLTKGTVGIVEACSGIRSLQSGLMVSLAVGELLGLARKRRIGLVGFAIAFALLSNLARTFSLCWIMEHQGDEAMHHWHDRVGNIAMYSLYVVIYLLGKLLEPRGGAPWPEGSGSWLERARRLQWTAVPDIRPLLAVSAVTFAVVHGWYFVLKLHAKPQTQPYFTLRPAGETNGIFRSEFDEQVWHRLGADSGEQVRKKTGLAPLGIADSYHLFWRPSPMSKIALHHRPDVCMPGSGWVQKGDVEPVTIEIDGHPLRFLAFQFERGDLKAVQLWGVWRNGKPVEMDYSNHLTALPEKYRPIPSERHLQGVELVSMFVPYQGEYRPPESLFRKLLPELFAYHAPPPETQ